MALQLKNFLSACLLMAASLSAWAGLPEGYAALAKKDYALALKEFGPLAKSGNAEAQFNLGVMYDNGRGVAKNDKEAAKWFRLAADHGDADAQFNLGLMYAMGKGLAQDDKAAVKWYRLTAMQGNADAQVNLAGMQKNGQGVAQDPRDAVRRYRLSADHGNAFAQSNLGAMYANGQGVAPNKAVAYALYNLSASMDPSSTNNAIVNRTALASELSPSLLDAGQALTREMGKPGNVLKALDAYLKNPR